MLQKDLDDAVAAASHLHDQLREATSWTDLLRGQRDASRKQVARLAARVAYLVGNKGDIASLDPKSRPALARATCFLGDRASPDRNPKLARQDGEGGATEEGTTALNADPAREDGGGRCDDSGDDDDHERCERERCEREHEHEHEHGGDSVSNAGKKDHDNEPGDGDDSCGTANGYAVDDDDDFVSANDSVNTNNNDSANDNVNPNGNVSTNSIVTTNGNVKTNDIANTNDDFNTNDIVSTNDKVNANDNISNNDNVSTSDNVSANVNDDVKTNGNVNNTKDEVETNGNISANDNVDTNDNGKTNDNINTSNHVKTNDNLNGGIPKREHIDEGADDESGPDPSEANDMLRTLASLSVKVRQRSCAEAGILPATPIEPRNGASFAAVNDHGANSGGGNGHGAGPLKSEPEQGFRAAASEEALWRRVSVLEAAMATSPGFDFSTARYVRSMVYMLNK